MQAVWHPPGAITWGKSKFPFFTKGATRLWLGFWQSIWASSRALPAGTRQTEERKMLVECSWVMLRYNTWAQRLVQRISRGQRTRKKQAVIALARKLLVRCWAMLRDGQPWRAEKA